MDPNRLKQLLEQYFNNTIGREDCKALLKYLDEADPVQFSGVIDELLRQQTTSARLDEHKRLDIYNNLLYELQQHQIKKETKVRFISGRWLNIAAAVVLILLSIAFFLHTSTQHSTPGSISSADNQDILLPDGRQAMLALSTGRTMVLNDSLYGILAQDDGTIIRGGPDGDIEYEATAVKKKKAIFFNTLTTPKGYSHHVKLSDGTEVWLNSESSLRFPVAFTGEERRVSLTGEAYFEVAHQPAHPFVVEANGSVVQVLGTHFNVTAYKDEPKVITTLVEGKVTVSKNGHNLVLAPGEQAVMDIKTGKLEAAEADVEASMAWKNGYFRFENESIESIMNKVSRWYDIEKVTYKGQFNDRFTGTFHRSKSAAQLFRMLEHIASVKFKIIKKEVLIMK